MAEWRVYNMSRWWQSCCIGKCFEHQTRNQLVINYVLDSCCPSDGKTIVIYWYVKSVLYVAI